uniref:Uncharacterized protein n=1 Tax=Bursaphelenchus xylophilus TaxID=6326 RepID=A0A1I7SV06_BURXY
MSSGVDYVSLIVDDVEDTEPSIEIVYEYNDGESSTVKNYEEFLVKWEEIKAFLAHEDTSISVVLVRMFNSIPWVTKEIEIEIGKRLKEYHTQVNIILRTSEFLEEEAVKLSPYFLAEVGPHVRFIQCHVTELPRLRGWFADKLELIYSRGAIFYIPELFEMGIKKINAGRSIKLDQFFMSRFPCQPSCQTLKCHVDMDIPLTDKGSANRFYENIFSEISESLPNLKCLKLTCLLLFENQDQLHAQTQLFVQHIDQLAKHTHIQVKVDMKVIDHDEAATKKRVETTKIYLEKLEGAMRTSPFAPWTIIFEYPNARFMIIFHYPYHSYLFDLEDL